MAAVRMRVLLAVCGALTLPACAAHYAQVPARLQLEPYGRIALVTFSAERPADSLDALATRHFAEELLASQTNVELIELGPTDSTVRRPAPTGVGAGLA